MKYKYNHLSRPQRAACFARRWGSSAWTAALEAGGWEGQRRATNNLEAAPMLTVLPQRSWRPMTVLSHMFASWPGERYSWAVLSTNRPEEWCRRSSSRTVSSDKFSTQWPLSIEVQSMVRKQKPDWKTSSTTRRHHILHWTYCILYWTLLSTSSTWWFEP